jgi:hypothetical protein
MLQVVKITSPPPPHWTVDATVRKHAEGHHNSILSPDLSVDAPVREPPPPPPNCWCPFLKKIPQTVAIPVDAPIREGAKGPPPHVTELLVPLSREDAACPGPAPAAPEHQLRVLPAPGGGGGGQPHQRDHPLLHQENSGEASSPECIEWFIEEQTFSPSYDLAPLPPLESSSGDTQEDWERETTCLHSAASQRKFNP